MDSVLKEIYYDVSHPAGYGGVEKLYHAVRDRGITRLKVKQWLKKQKVYTLHKPARKRFPRRRVEVMQIDQQFQLDLADMSNISRYNKGYRYILVVIDSFSRYCWALPLKNKKPITVINAFKKVLKIRRPDGIFSDNGTEFRNKKFKSFLHNEGIQFFTSNNQDVKASIAERMIRTLKSKLYKHFTANNTYNYLKVLPKILESYNNSKHRSIQMAPANVNYDNAEEIRVRRSKNVTNMRFKYNIGDTVRVSKVKHIFDKGYYPNYTEEIFTVAKREKRNGIPFYKLKDDAGEVLKGFFYQEEIQSVIKPDLWEVENVIKRRGRGSNKEYLVKWKGYDSKFNSWVKNIYKNVQHL
jgi:transposase InsO family protein